MAYRGPASVGLSVAASEKFLYLVIFGETVSDFIDGSCAESLLSGALEALGEARG